jgi:hypothetical protein
VQAARLRNYAPVKARALTQRFGSQGLDFGKLFGRDQATRDAAGGFANQAIPIALIGLVRIPAGVVTLVTCPLGFATVDAYQDLKFTLFGAFVPPTKLHCHKTMTNGRAGWRASGNACELEIACGVVFAARMFYTLRCLFVATLLASFARADFARDLVRIHTEMSGGREAVLALHGLNAYGLTRTEQGERPLVIRAERPNRVCIEVSTSVAGRTLAQGWDGQSEPWTIDSATRQLTPISGDAVEAFKAEAEFDDPLMAGPDRKFALDYAGEVTEGATEYLKVMVTLNFTSVSFLYLDPASYLIVRRDVVRRVRGQEVVLRTDYSDFRPVQGVLLPHRWVLSQAGKQLRETVIDHMEPNPVFAAHVFSPRVADAK